MSNVKAKSLLLQAAYELSPSLKEQEVFTKMVRDMERDLHTNKDICLALAQGIVDGLRHGNWPS